MTTSSLRIHAELIRSISVMAFAALIVILSGLATLFLLPTTLIMLFGVILGQVGSAGVAAIYALFWCLAALWVAIYNLVTALEIMHNPTWRGAGRLIVSSVAISITCPFLWVWWSLA